MSFHEQTPESDRLAVLDTSHDPFLSCVLDWDWPLEPQLGTHASSENLLGALVLLSGAGWGEDGVVCTELPQTGGSWSRCHPRPSFDCMRSAQSGFGLAYSRQVSVGSLRKGSV